MARLLALALLTACVPEHGHHQTGTGGVIPVQGGTVGSNRDGGIPVEPGRIRGRICAITDVRAGAACEPIANLTLRIGVQETGASTVTNNDGFFDLPGTERVNPVTLITAADHDVWAGSVFPVFLAELGSASVDVPLIRRTDLDDLAAANLYVIDPTNAVIVGYAQRNLAPAANVTATAIDGIAPLYDDGSPLVFSVTGPTGAAGTILWFNVGPGPRITTLTLPGAGDGGVPLVTRYTIPTVARAVTFVALDF